jgi:hypothetical protein
LEERRWSDNWDLRKRYADLQKRCADTQNKDEENTGDKLGNTLVNKAVAVEETRKQDNNKMAFR